MFRYCIVKPLQIADNSDRFISKGFIGDNKQTLFEGEMLREKAVDIPYKMAGCVALDEKDATELYRIFHKILQGFGK